jgi:two-component system response regulator YesN
VTEQRHSEEIARKVVDALNVIRQTAGRYMKEEEVAARVGLSRSWFSQCFKEITGTEFKRYLVDKSIAEAKNLLAHTDMPFRSISARLGYQNEGHFSRMFRAATGVRPGDFRAHARSSGETT